MPPAGFEPAIPAGEQLQTHALDRLATGIGTLYLSGQRIREIFDGMGNVVQRTKRGKHMSEPFGQYEFWRPSNRYGNVTAFRWIFRNWFWWWKVNELTQDPVLWMALMSGALTHSVPLPRCSSLSAAQSEFTPLLCTSGDLQMLDIVMLHTMHT
jgi:hypothetical protein